MTDWLEWLLDEAQDEDETGDGLELEARKGVEAGGCGAGAERPETETAGALEPEDGDRPEGLRSARDGTAEAAGQAGAVWVEAAPAASGAGVERDRAGMDRRRPELEAGGEAEPEGYAARPGADGGRADGVKLPRRRAAARTGGEAGGQDAGDGRKAGEPLDGGSAQADGAAGDAEDALALAAARRMQAEGPEAGALADRLAQAQDGGAAVYRRLLRLGRAESAARTAGESGGTRRQEVDAPSLTVDELDRAVRRDSRRYDGGMELY